VSTDPFDEQVLAHATGLRVIARVGVGTDSIDLEAASRHGVVVTTTPGANRDSTADHAVALMLAALRRLTEHDRAVREGGWPRGGAMTPWSLHDTTVGLVGYGSIGKAVARRLRGFSIRLLVADPALDGVEGGELVALDELLRRADVVSLHLPLRAATRRLIGARELALLGPEGILVNTARGGLVDQGALVRALTRGGVRAAALDVFEAEPTVPPALFALPNVVLTPHIGGLSDRSVDAMVKLATRSVIQVLAGRPDRRVIVNPDALQHAKWKGCVA
jgi:phosphoglycerate dehydrogenase-like enzyme